MLSLPSSTQIYPLRSGWIAIDVGRLGAIGAYGLGWSLRPAPDTSHAYRFSFDKTELDPSGSVNRWRAFPIRYLSTV